jgi:hypothetical protein
MLFHVNARINHEKGKVRDAHNYAFGVLPVNKRENESPTLCGVAEASVFPLGGFSRSSMTRAPFKLPSPRHLQPLSLATSNIAPTNIALVFSIPSLVRTSSALFTGSFFKMNRPAFVSLNPVHETSEIAIAISLSSIESFPGFLIAPARYRSLRSTSKV